MEIVFRSVCDEPLMLRNKQYAYRNSITARGVVDNFIIFCEDARIICLVAYSVQLLRQI